MKMPKIKEDESERLFNNKLNLENAEFDMLSK
jgi:hypothetical protein